MKSYKYIQDAAFARDFQRLYSSVVKCEMELASLSSDYQMGGSNLRQELQHNNLIWHPYAKCEIVKIESTQR